MSGLCGDEVQAVLVQQAGVNEAPDHLGGDASLLKIALDYLQELARTTERGFNDHALYMAYNMGPSGARRAQAAGIVSTDYTEAVLEIYRSYMTEMEWAG